MISGMIKEIYNKGEEISMDNKITEERKLYARDIAQVRRTGLVNMLDRRGVIEVLEGLGCANTAEYIECNKKDYMELLKESSNY